MGESGSGKSTLLSMMGALNSPTSGKYLVGGIDVYGLGQEERADFRRKSLGFVFQSFHLIPYLTVRENVMLPLATGREKGDEETRSGRRGPYPGRISGKRGPASGPNLGGEQERVAIARATVNHPSILLADEPTGNLDSKTTREIMELLKRLNEDGMTILMVTHNPECAHYAGRILRIADGLLSSRGAAGAGSCFSGEGQRFGGSGPEKVKGSRGDGLKRPSPLEFEGFSNS